MDTSHYHRIVAWGERGVLFLLVLYLCVHTMPRAWGSLITDFPSYYMSARLVREGYDTSRMYEWTWLQREKDHRGVDVRVTGLLPITPFSTLVMEPLAGLAPLAAKHIWILVNLALVAPIGWMLRAMTGLSLQRIALVFALSFPLHRNLLFGQFYVFLLLLIVAACCAYLRGFRALAGGLVALAAACKIFPILLFVFFLQRKEWRALIGGLVTGLAAIALSIMVFGLSVHRTYLYEILPWTLHGEGLQPYVARASFSGVLHYLFLSEPQWNPHPWHSSPLCYALLLPTLQMLVLAPAVLLIRREDGTRERKLLECSALLTASLAISTIPASYNFVLMVLPVCVLAGLLLQRERYGWLAALLIVYLGIGFPLPNPPAGMGPAVLLYLPRLPLMLALLFGIYAVLLRDRPTDKEPWKWTYYAWSAAMAISVVFSVLATFRLERDARQEYAYRLPLKSQEYLNSVPRAAGAGVRYIAFILSGYHLVTEDPNGGWSDSVGDLPDDDLSFAVGPATNGRETIWVEQALSQGSRIVDVRIPSHIVVDDAREPMLSADSQSLAFIRDDHGRGATDGAERPGVRRHQRDGSYAGMAECLRSVVSFGETIRVFRRRAGASATNLSK